ncbi:MAG: hypothetical protein QM736_10210 [Vicinamibacterales bacterium]
MHSRPARLTLSALAWIALGAAAYFAVHLQAQIDHRRSTLRAFETSARDAADALDDAQAAQQAYVALGQTSSDWFPKVSTYLQTANTSVESLRSSALSQAAGPSLLDAASALTQIGNVDRQARERLAADDRTGAADAIFADGADAFSNAVSNVDAAVGSEQQAADAFEAAQRRVQLYVAGAAVGFAALVLLFFGLLRTTPRSEEETQDAGEQPSDSFAGLSLNAPSAPQAQPANSGVASAPALFAMADVCTNVGRVRESAELRPLIERAATILNARGIIVWLGSTAGADLRPVLAHGYSDAALSHIPMLSRHADNAAAAAYRSGELQIQKSQGGAHGTIVTPLLTADGCIGAITAEIRDRGEESEQTRALAVFFAAQLASLLTSAADASSVAPETRTQVAAS